MRVCIRSKVGKTGRRHWQVLSGGVVVVSAHSFEKAVEMMPVELLKIHRERERADAIYDALEPTGRHSKRYKSTKLENVSIKYQKRILERRASAQREALAQIFGSAVAST